MSAHEQHGDEARAGYEKRDFSVGAAGLFFVGLFILIAGGLLLSWGVFDFLAGWRAETDPAPPPLAVTRPSRPPEPRLQVNPPAELETVRREEEALLNSYGWVQKEAGVVRIPIERAKKLLLERGLPARPSADAADGSE